LTTFLDRLRNNTLTDVDQYRQMKKTLVTSDSVTGTAGGDEWKSWELVPVSAGRHSDSAEQDSAGRQNVAALQTALSRLGN